MIKQNDERLLEPIQKIGCFFVSCADVAQMKTQKTLTAEQINEVWQWAKETKRIDSLDNITNSASIINRFLRVLGDKGKFFEVATTRDKNDIAYYPSVKNNAPELMRIDAVIQKIKQGGASRTHFRVCNKDFSVLEDPHEPPIKALDVYYNIIYAYKAEE